MIATSGIASSKATAPRLTEFTSSLPTDLTAALINCRIVDGHLVGFEFQQHARFSLIADAPRTVTISQPLPVLYFAQQRKQAAAMADVVSRASRPDHGGDRRHRLEQRLAAAQGAPANPASLLHDWTLTIKHIEHNTKIDDLIFVIKEGNRRRRL